MRTRHTLAPHARRLARTALLAAACLALLALGACATKTGYGVGPQAEAEQQMRAAVQDPAPDTPGMYLGLIERMQGEGLYYASLAHIDAYEHQYGTSPQSILLRADALRSTGQSVASAAAYAQLIGTPLEGRGHRGLGLLAGGAGDFHKAAQELAAASALAPTDAATLSDLGYALLRDGDVAGARVPLLKAIELDAHNPRIAANVALYLVASGNADGARNLMAQQNLPPEARAAIARDARKVEQAQRTREVSDAPVPVPKSAAALLPAPHALADAAGANANAPGAWGGEGQGRLVGRLMQ
ncbi:tetratricopeptide repeat protein [Paraburkholderia acidisoli]|uniref:tetratricopeptide repeat protein n=1 Tax=Paraburkholderia acidisoli TaxID=2571748 RepID=UPI0018EEFB55|nr:pilus assembly protein [Paraburkholderia acidisoli]